MQGNANLQLSVNEFSKVVQNRRDLYEGLIRNGFYLPKYKTTMITEDYMRNVMHGKAYCPKYSEIKMMPCPRPPTVDVLLKKFISETHGTYVCNKRQLSHQELKTYGVTND